MLGKIKTLLLVTTALVFSFAFAPFSYGADTNEPAEELDNVGEYEDEYDYDYDDTGCYSWYDHEWVDGGGYCYCINCGETKSHDWDLFDFEYPDCTTDGWETYECFDCGAQTSKTIRSTGHDFSGSKEWWWDYDNDCFKYGLACEECGTVKYVPKVIKKGKTKRIFPKSFKKKAKKIKVKRSKKKYVKAYKSGKVKGKKRGTCTVTYKVKYKRIGWITYKCQVKVK